MYISDVPFTKVHVTGSSFSFLNDVRTNDKETFYFPILFYVLINVPPPKKKIRFSLNCISVHRFGTLK
jgi:hypothetical protein